MNGQEAVALLTRSKPLGTKLATTSYEYVFDPADLVFILLYERIKAYLLETEDDAKHLYIGFYRYQQKGKRTSLSRLLFTTLLLQSQDV